MVCITASYSVINRPTTWLKCKKKNGVENGLKKESAGLAKQSAQTDRFCFLFFFLFFFFFLSLLLTRASGRSCSRSRSCRGSRGRALDYVVEVHASRGFNERLDLIAVNVNARCLEDFVNTVLVDFLSCLVED